MPGIALTIETLPPENYVAGVYPARITAVSSEPDIDGKIFVFHARSVDDALPGDQFECVASAQQLQELPVDAPITGENPVPYYRKSVVEFFFTDPGELDEVFTIIQSDTTLLIRSVRQLQSIGNPVTVVIDP